jgi:Transposase DDE domain group 1
VDQGGQLCTLLDRGLLHQVHIQPGKVGPFRSGLQPGQLPQTLRPSGEISHWSLRSVQLKLIKIGARTISHARRTIFHMAEAAVSGELFDGLLTRIRQLASVPTFHMKEESRWLVSKYQRNELFSAKSQGVNRWKEGNRLPGGNNSLNNGKIMASGGAYGKCWHNN